MKRSRRTVRSELSRVFREIALSLLYDFEDWIKEKLPAIKMLAKGMLVGFLVAFILWLFIHIHLDGTKIFLYFVFLVVTGIAYGVFYESYKKQKRDEGFRW